jgi:hypothetical protein
MGVLPRLTAFRHTCEISQSPSFSGLPLLAQSVHSANWRCRLSAINGSRLFPIELPLTGQQLDSSSQDVFASCPVSLDRLTAFARPIEIVGGPWIINNIDRATFSFGGIKHPMANRWRNLFIIGKRGIPSLPRLSCSPVKSRREDRVPDRMPSRHESRRRALRSVDT